MSCPGTAQFEEDSAGNDNTSFGNAGHQIMMGLARKQDVDVDAICNQWGITGDDADDLKWMAASVNFALPSDVQIEQRMESDILTGRPDLYIPASESRLIAHITDWKFGWMRVDARSPQMMSYAWLATRGKAACEVTIMQMRFRDSVSETLSAEEIAAWKSTLDAVYENINQPSDKLVFNTGDHCAWCEGRFTCRHFLKPLAVYSTDKVLPEITRENVAQWFSRIKTIEEVCDRVRQIAKAMVDEHGPLTLPDGSVYACEKSERDELKKIETMRVIMAALPNWPDAISVTKSGITNAARACQRGMSTKVWNELVAAGAVGKKTVARYTTTQPKKVMAQLPAPQPQNQTETP